MESASILSLDGNYTEIARLKLPDGTISKSSASFYPSGKSVHSEVILPDGEDCDWIALKNLILSQSKNLDSGKIILKQRI